MPPVQPVADSEPDRNPVLAYADSYRDMAKQGVESVPIWSVITDLERNIAPLYRHAQPAPVVPEEKPIPNTLSMYAVDAVAAIAEVKGWNACRAAMLQASPVCTCPSGDGSLRWPCPVHAGNSPVIPDSARDALEKALAAMEFMGDTLNNLDAVCTEDVELVAPAFDAVRSVLAAAPQSPGSEPATVPGKWIPVSERMPDNTEPVLCIEKRADFGTYGQPFVCWHDGGGWVGKTNYRPIVTHWMPLPAAPQEVKGE
ncbi:DUF551 domain-containing protein [Klebsiella pneumoniae]